MTVCLETIICYKSRIYTGFLSSLPRWKVKVKVAQLCLTHFDPMAYTVHGILQAKILERVAFPFSRGSSEPRDRTQAFHIADIFFTSWATGEAQEYWSTRVAYPFSRGPSQPRNWTRASCIAGRFFTSWAIREALQGELCIIDGYKEFHSLAYLLHPTKLSHSIYRYVINTNSFQSVFYLQGFHFQNESVFTQRPYMLVV